jgi:fumarate reductase flavoprotein subunit
MSLKPPPPAFDAEADVVVIGAGAAGLTAALAAREAGAQVVLVERDPIPRGSTALSAGLIPAAGTRFQAALGIADDPDAFARDIAAKAHGEADPALVRLMAREAGPSVEWLADRFSLPFSVVHDFDYPGHRARRMHGLPSRSGAELIDRLREAAEGAQAMLLGGAPAASLYVDEDRTVRGVEIARPDGSRESLGARALVLACNGYGGNPDLVARHIPDMRGALYFGHPGNRGDAIKWGEALGAKLAHLSAYQGHGSVAHPHGILITWATITEGGFQVNAQSERFSDESRGYSEQARDVIAQQGGLAWTIFDARIAGIARQFEDFRQAEAAGAIIEAGTIEELATLLKLPVAALAATSAEVEALKRGEGQDRFGREFAGSRVLGPPLRGVKVTGALFHTQGGLAVDGEARVILSDGGVAPNLFAAGGAAAGVSGSTASGYLSGNGLLTAVVLGRVAGRAAAKLAREAGA